VDDFALLVHGAVLSAAFVAYYRFSERSSEAKALAEVVKTTSERLQIGISESLRLHLKPVLNSKSSVDLNQILDDLGKPFFSHHNAPPDTRAFKDALSEFVREKRSALQDFCMLRKSHSRWGISVCIRGWVGIITLVWEIPVVAIVALFSQVYHKSIPDPVLIITFVITGILVFLYIAATACTLHHHNQISNLANYHV
jgi:hypothetical protein